MRNALVLFVIGLCLASVQAQLSPVVDVHQLKVGEAAPTFVLNDQTGKKRSLEAFTKNGMVALVFYRSAD
jgi:cytochrome oxidase Cu insertion factor (SCO1/SenC/PrrC family)